MHVKSMVDKANFLSTDRLILSAWLGENPPIDICFINETEIERGRTHLCSSNRVEKGVRQYEGVKDTRHLDLAVG